MTIVTGDNILEIESLDNSTPSFSCFKYEKMGYCLYALKNTWVFPFKRTKVKLNIKMLTLPDRTIGLISGNNNPGYDVITKKAICKNDFIKINVISNRLLPFKIKKGSEIAILSIIPIKQCYAIGENIVER